MYFNKRGEKVKRILVTIMFCLFLSGVAYAQCSWVLWEQEMYYKPKSGGEWVVNSAYPTYELCSKKREEKLKNAKKFWGIREDNPHRTLSGGPVGDLEYGFIIYEHENSRQALYFYESKCLPDTIDPRK